jgi:hypothetical protein
MAFEIDPKNLSAANVLRFVAPTFSVITAMVLVRRFAPNFLWLLIVLFVVAIYVTVVKLPKKERELDDKIEGSPGVGPIAKPIWRILNWVVIIFGAFTMTLLVLASVKGFL